MSGVSADAGARGLFLVVEGVEGAGKTTQVGLLAGWLRERGVEPVVAREPGGTPVGEAIRRVVLKDPELDVPPVSELMLILAARAAFVAGVVRPALEEGRVVVADRYELSTLAYQGHGRELPLDEVRRANALATGGLRPDLCVVLDLPVQEGMARQRSQGKVADRMESEGRDFLERVRRGYLAEAEGDAEVELVDAAGTPEEVHARVRRVVEPLLSGRGAETFGSGGA